MYSPYQPAPPDEMVRYLAVLRRPLQTIARRGSQDSVSGLLFTGWLADALHNVPGILWHWDKVGCWTPMEINAWITDKFPASLEKFGGTPAIVEEARTITAVSGDDAASLGLADDLSDLSIAPEAALERYLGLVYNYFLAARGIRSYDRSRNNPVYALLGTSIVNKQKVREIGKASGRVASILQEIPAALVAWERFDEQAFIDRALARVETVSSGYANHLRHALAAWTKPSA